MVCGAISLEGQTAIGYQHETLRAFMRPGAVELFPVDMMFVTAISPQLLLFSDVMFQTRSLSIVA